MNEKTQFLEKFKSEFLEAEDIEFTEATKFRDLDSWDSLTGMAIQVMIEDNYSVKLTVDKFKTFHTVGEIYGYVVNLSKI